MFKQMVVLSSLLAGIGSAGMAITLAAVYRPAWLATFEADRYFAD